MDRSMKVAGARGLLGASLAGALALCAFCLACAFALAPHAYALDAPAEERPLAAQASVAQASQEGNQAMPAQESEQGLAAQEGKQAPSAQEAAQQATQQATQERALQAAASEQYATLTIIASTKDATSAEFDANGATTLVNKQYAMQEGDVLLNLLEKAQAAGDIKGVVITNSGMLGSITNKEGTTIGNDIGYALDPNDASASLYWALFDNGGYASYGVNGLLLKPTGSYQLVWLKSKYDFATDITEYITAAPTSPAAWSAWYGANPPAAAEGQKPATPAAPSKPAPAADEAVGNERDVMTSIADSYKGTADAWEAFDLAALGMAGDVDKDKLLADALAAVKAGGNPVKYVIALTALGYDCTKLPDGNATYDMVNASLKDYANSSDDIYTIINSLWALSSGDYDFTYSYLDSGVFVNDLIDSLLAMQLESGAFGSDSDSDTTAMAINALAPYAGVSASRQAALDKALAALKGMQTANGDWADAYGKLPNSSSTAFAIIAMAAAGLDPASDWTTASGISPVEALLSYAVKTKDGYMFKWLADDEEPSAFSTEQAFRALVAHRGLVAMGGAPFNIYTDAVMGIATIPAEPKPEAPATNGANQIVLASYDPSDNPATGDAGMLAVLLLALLACGALAGAGACRRQIESMR